MKSSTLALIELSESPSFSPILISLPSPFRQAIVHPDSATLLSDTGLLWLCQSSAQWFPSTIELTISVKWIACADSVSLAVSTQGQAFAWGTDSEETGLLGVEGVFEAHSPVLISDLSKANLTQIAIGATHAAAVDSIAYIETGKVYSWGTGFIGQLGGSLYTETKIRPRLVEGTRAFSVKKVLCGKECTVVCTSGGFVYVFGRLGSHGGHKTPGSGRQQNRPKAPSHFEEVYAADICLGTDFLSMVTESGLVYSFDDCLELIQMPALPGTKVYFLCSNLTSLLGLSSKFYLGSGGLLQQWVSGISRRNEVGLIDKLVLEEKISCSLCTWKGVTYLLDEPWDSCCGVYTSHCDFLCMQLSSPQSLDISDHPIGHIVSELKNPKLSEFTEKLMETCQFPVEIQSPQATSIPSDSDTDMSVSEVNTSSVTVAKTFERVMKAKLAEQQEITIRKGFSRPLVRLFAYAMTAIKESRGQHKQRRRLIAIQQASKLVLSLVSRVSTDRVLTGFEAVRLYSERRAYECEAKNRAASLIFHYVISVSSERQTEFQSCFLEKISVKARLYQRLSTLLPQIVKTINGNSLRTQRIAVKCWREIIVREGMRKWGLGKLARLLTRISTAHCWAQISAYAHYTSLRLSVLERLLRRRTREKARKDISRLFTNWKHYVYQWSIQKISHLQSLQVSCKAVFHALRRVIRSQALLPAFSRVDEYVKTRSKTANLRQPLLYFSSIYEKMYTRAYSWAYNNLLRFNPQTMKAKGRHRLKALARLGEGTVRRAFREFIEMSMLLGQQAVVYLIYRLQRTLDRYSSRSKAYAFTCLDLHSSIHRVHEKEDSLVELGDSHDGSLGRCFAAIQPDPLTSRSNYYFSPEETAQYLMKDIDIEDLAAKPLELTNMSIKTLTPKHAKDARADKSGGSPHSLPIRPPWRAPSKSGMPKPVVRDGIIRRRVYDTVLKERQARRWGRVESPVMRGRGEKGLIELVRASGEIRGRKGEKMDENYRTLSLILGFRALQKARTHLLTFVWSLLHHHTPIRRPKVRAVTVIPSMSLSQGDMPDSADLESSWKVRMMGVGCQRLAKIVESRNKLLLYGALLEVRDYMVFG